MYINVKGLVIGAMNIRESDKYLTVLTDELGKIKVSARGGSKKDSQFLSASQLFAYSRLSLNENKGYYYINSAENISQFYHLSQDVEKLSLASYFAELAGAVTEAGMNCADMLRLCVCALYVLSEKDRPLPLVKAAFELKLMALSGFYPELDICAVCEETPKEPFFNIRHGLLHCKACRDHIAGGTSLPLSPGALNAMHFIANSDIGKIFDFSLDDGSMRLLCDVCEAYVLSQLERDFKTLSFYKNLTSFTP